MSGSKNVVKKVSANLSNDGGATSATDENIAVKLPQTQPSPFQIGEIVRVDHNPLLYKAEVMKVDFVQNEWWYTVHPCGFKKKTRDEVVGLDRLTKYDEAYRPIQEEHDEKQEMASNEKLGSKPKIAQDSTTLSNESKAISANDIEDSKEEDAVNLPPTQPSPFQVGEIVRVNHNTRLYKAKVLKVDFVQNEWRYTVYLCGFKKKNREEVVSLGRLIKYDEAYRPIQEEHNEKQEMASNEKPGSKPKKNLVAEDSATLSNDGVATSVTDNSIEDSKEEDAVEVPPTQPSPFQEGEIVLAYHNQFRYRAKILKVDFEQNKWRYTVHYTGWKKSWDEVLGMDRLIKYPEANRQSQEVHNEQEEHNEKQEMESNEKLGSKRKRASGKKRKTGLVQKEKAMPSKEMRVNIHIPPSLKKLLIHDWDYVTHLGKLVKLPRSPNVDKVLGKYHDYQLKKHHRLAGSVGEVVNGLRRYFDKALPAMLLYKNERQQYKEAMTDNVSPSAVYGAEHLLRLFVKLPEILQNAGIEETMLIELQQHLVDFIKFLQKNQRFFFLGAQQPIDILD